MSVRIARDPKEATIKAVRWCQRVKGGAVMFRTMWREKEKSIGTARRAN